VSGKPSSWLSIEACLFHTASLVVMGDKLGTDPWTSQSACYGLSQEPFFSETVGLFKSIDNYVKGCYALTA
jgi:ribonuclease I